MPQYDLLKQALSDAMQFNKQPTQYVDIFGNAMKAQREGIQHRQLERADELDTALQESMSGLGESPQVEDILQRDLKVRAAYGDGKGLLENLTLQKEMKQAELEAEQKKADKLLRELKDIAGAAKDDPELARRMRGITGTDQVDDSMIERIYRESGRRSQGGGSEKYKIFYDAKGNEVTVGSDRASVDAALARGLKSKKGIDSTELLRQLLGIDLPDPNEGGEDIGARDNNRAPENPAPTPTPKASMSPKPPSAIDNPPPPKAGYKRAFNEQTKSWDYIKK